MTVDRVSDLELAPFQLDTITDQGTAVASAPGAQEFWVASGQSTVEALSEAQLAWEIQDGRYEIVIMNADGSAGVIDRWPRSGPACRPRPGCGLLVLGIGVALMVGGGALLYVGIRGNRVRPPPGRRSRSSCRTATPDRAPNESPGH